MTHDESSIELLRDAIARLHEDQREFRASFDRRLDRLGSDVNGIATRFDKRIEKLEEWHIADSAETRLKLVSRTEAQEQEGRSHARSIRRVSRLAAAATLLSAVATVVASLH